MSEIDYFVGFWRILHCKNLRSWLVSLLSSKFLKIVKFSIFYYWIPLKSNFCLSICKYITKLFMLLNFHDSPAASFSIYSLFSNSSCILLHLDGPSPVPSVYGIKWGQYVGSPAYFKPVISWSDKFSTCIARVVSFSHSYLFILPPNSTHMRVTRTRNRTMHVVWSAVLSWNHVDDIIRVWDIKKGTTSGFKENMNFHKVSRP